MNSDGSGYRAIILPVGGHREPTEIHHLIPHKDADGEMRRDADLILDGTAVLNFSTQRMPPAMRSLCEYAKTPIESIDYFVLHQANRMINETIRKKLQLTPEKVPSTLHDFGNTSSASVPLTMTVCLRERLTSGPGDGVDVRIRHRPVVGKLHRADRGHRDARAGRAVSDDPFSLEGKRILVTGASSGLGRADRHYVRRSAARQSCSSGTRRSAARETRRSMPAGDHVIIRADLIDAAAA